MAAIEPSPIDGGRAASRVDVTSAIRLADYSAVTHLAGTVQGLQDEAARVAPKLRGRTLWMINSTARGGGVAEMLPTMVGCAKASD